MKHGLGLLLIFLCCSALWGQGYEAGFKSVALVDSSRVYKPNTSTSHPLHYRPVELDIWYPSEEMGNQALTFGELFQLFEQRAVKYQDEQDYTGISNELAQFYVAELGVGTDPNLLLQESCLEQALLYLSKSHKHLNLNSSHENILPFQLTL